MSKRVAVPLADGFEEIEAVTIIDVLRRAECEVVTFALDGKMGKGAHGIDIEADKSIGEIEAADFDALVLPGGMPGSENLANSEEVKRLAEKLFHANKVVAAICAAPWALGNYGLLDGKDATSYPGFDEKIPNANYQEDRVVVDGKIVTSRGPGTALEFALKLVEILEGEEKAGALREGMLVKA